MKRKMIAGGVFIIVLFTSCYLFTPLRFMNISLMDHQKMPYVTLRKSDMPFAYHLPAEDNYKEITGWLNANLSNTSTAAFVVVKNDSIVYERYFGDYNASTLFPSFSVIKSFIGTLTGIALQEGKIKSLSEPITNYLPAFSEKDKRFKSITIRHLLDMRSGIQWKEGSYGADDDAVRMGFSPNIMKKVMKIQIATSPTDEPEYKSIDTMLLGLIISKATGKPLAEYFEEKLWRRMGTAYDATLTTDRKKLPVTYAGLNATARDFAKLGTLYLKNGTVNNQQVVSPEWISSSVNADSMRINGGYKNQWWSGNTGNMHLFFAQGILGQFIYTVPEKQLVIVRLGHFWHHPSMYAATLIKQAALKY